MAVLIAGGLIGCAQVTSPSLEPSKQTSITARVAADQMGMGFNIGQMFENEQHTPSFEEARPKIDAYYALGHRNVRIPITWTESMYGSMMVNDPDVGDVNFDHPRVRELIKIVDYALSLPGMYVVINAHHEKTLKRDNKYKVIERIWADLSNYFKDRDFRLLYEILNEPHIDTDPMPVEHIRYMTELAYKRIRAVDPHRIIIIGGNQWFAAKELMVTWPDLEPIGGGKDAYIMATIHHYEPWSFHGEDGDKSAPWTLENIVEPMEQAEHWAATVGNNMPIYIGEWGNGWGKQFDKFDCNQTREWYRLFDSTYASQREQGVMPTAVWDDGGWFMIWSHEEDAFNNNLHQCISGKCVMTGEAMINAGCRSK
ncbi:glycoside hydrolase family 5 protein [Alteromonas sediminis]|uniref:Glycoside hydrolase family 5 protein n=2 Tax=Alteromonas sediminis TaxID=2259342 RepID=A0A3N5Y573_9ALTE|nr:glycoside hydrolase family 5 protein [Alteromonas sediminis]